MRRLPVVVAVMVMIMAGFGSGRGVRDVRLADPFAMEVPETAGELERERKQRHHPR